MYSFPLESPIGLLFVSVTRRGLRRLDVLLAGRIIGESPRLAGESLEAGQPPGEGEAALAAAVEGQLDEYFHGERRHFDLPLDLTTGTAFQRRVWDTIARIPYGEFASYAEVAQSAGAPGAFRAAGTACGANPVAIVTPCHRVIASGNRLGGYGLGLENKVWLLRHEGVDVDACRPDGRVRPAAVGVDSR